MGDDFEVYHRVLVKLCSYKSSNLVVSSHSEFIMPSRLNEQQRQVIVYLKTKGLSLRAISQEVGCSPNAVKGVFERFESTGTTDELGGRGRKRKSTARDERSLVRLCLSNRKKSSVELTREWKETSGVDVDASTVRRRLIANGLKSYRPRKKPLITEKQRLKRLAWAKEHKSWSVEQWSRVIFSDESTFTLNQHSGNS